MSAFINIDMIWLNKRGSDHTSDWAYYRFTSLGKDGDMISACQVEWPSLKDIDELGDADKAIVSTPGLTGFAIAFPTMVSLLQNKWNIDHKHSIVIGLIARQPEVPLA